MGLDTPCIVPKRTRITGERKTMRELIIAAAMLAASAGSIAPAAARGWGIDPNGVDAACHSGQIDPNGCPATNSWWDTLLSMFG
jgi:hypothetical protein